MRALKTSSNKVDYKIECYQHLDESNYQISIWVNSKNIFDKEYKYNQLLMSDEVKDIIKFVSNYLIKEIREEK